MNDSFLLNLHGPVAHLQLNRPERANTLSPAFFTALREAVRGLCEGAAVRALVISSTGAQFSAGLAAEAGSMPPNAPPADRRNPNESAAREAVGAILHMLDERAAPGPGAAAPPVQRLLDGLHVLGDAPFPVICAVQGACAGAALALACACDIRVCSADASFTPHGADPGAPPDPAVLQAVARLLPPGPVHELACTNEPLGAQRAHEWGFVNAVLPDAVALTKHALALAERIAVRPFAAASAAKLALRRTGASDWGAPTAMAPPARG